MRRTSLAHLTFQKYRQDARPSVRAHDGIDEVDHRRVLDVYKRQGFVLRKSRRTEKENFIARKIVFLGYAPVVSRIFTNGFDGVRKKSGISPKKE